MLVFSNETGNFMEPLEVHHHNTLAMAFWILEKRFQAHWCLGAQGGVNCYVSANFQRAECLRWHSGCVKRDLEFTWCLGVIFRHPEGESGVTPVLISVRLNVGTSVRDKQTSFRLRNHFIGILPDTETESHASGNSRRSSVYEDDQDTQKELSQQQVLSAPQTCRGERKILLPSPPALKLKSTIILLLISK